MKALLLLAALASSAQATAPLRLWHAYRGGEEAALQKSVALFEKQTGIPVELLAVPYDAFAPKLISSIPHGAGPDVFIMAHERVRQFTTMGLIAPVDDALDRKAYFPNALQAFDIAGHVYGFPMSLKCLGLYVNDELVARAPKTTAEMLPLLARLGDGDSRFGLAYEAGDFYYHAPFLFGFGGRLFNAAGRAVFDTPEMARSLAFVKDLQDRRLMPEELSGALVKSLFNEGRAAMVISGPWFAGEVSPAISYSVVPLPRVSQTGLPMRPFLGVEAAIVSARSDNPEAARKLARFLSLGEAAVVRALIGGQVPANAAAYADPRVSNNRLVAEFRDAARDATPMPNTLEMARVWEPMKLALRAVLQGGTSPEEAGALADRRYRALYPPAPSAASPLPYLVILALLAVASAYRFLTRARSPLSFAQRYPDAGLAARYLAPAAAGIFVLVLVPLAVGLGLSFFYHQAGRYSFVGLANFVDILASRGYRITEPLSFYFTLAVTMLWTFIGVSLHVAIGLALALLLKDPLLKLKGVYRVLLIVPWAVPNYITALMWKGMFHRQFGAINGLLRALHLEPMSWFARFSTAFAANIIANTWLGFPFMMVVALGALQSIPRELYEAADVDGASSWQMFRRITLPLLRPAMLPAIILGGVWTFNMFNVVYLVSGGEPGGATDILVSEAYRWAFQRNEQYGFAAAYAVLILLTLWAWSVLARRVSEGAEDALR